MSSLGTPPCAPGILGLCEFAMFMQKNTIILEAPKNKVLLKLCARKQYKN